MIMCNVLTRVPCACMLTVYESIPYRQQFNNIYLFPDGVNIYIGVIIVFDSGITHAIGVISVS